MATRTTLRHLTGDSYGNAGKAIYPLVAKPSFRERLQVTLIGRTKLFVDSTNFTKPTEIYLFYCPKHRLWQKDYLHGKGSLNCTRCMNLEYFCLKLRQHGPSHTSSFLIAWVVLPIPVAVYVVRTGEVRVDMEAWTLRDAVNPVHVNQKNRC